MLLVLQDDLRDSLLGGVGERKRNVSRAQSGCELGGLAVEGNGGAASGLAAHFNIAPTHPVVPTRAEGFHSCFLGRETRRVTLHAVGLRLAVADLALGVDSLQKAIAEARERRRNPWDFGNVNAGANDHLS